MLMKQTFIWFSEINFQEFLLALEYPNQPTAD